MSPASRGAARVASRSPADSHRRRRGQLSDGAVAFLMILPAGVLFALFYLLPFVNGFLLSLKNWDGFSDPTWAGLGNYVRLGHDQVFLGALRHNFVFVVAVVILKNALGLGLALLLNRAIFGQTFFRAAAFIPVTMSFVAVGLLWSWIYNPVFGLLDAALDLVGLGGLKRSWLGDSEIALYSIIVVDVWKWLGFHAVIFLAALQTIPAELHEAATVDGAPPWRQFWHITLPHLRPIVFLSTILGLSGAFVRNFDIVYVLTKGGPNHATEVVLTYMVNKAFHDGAMGYAAAMGYVLFVIVGVATVALLALMRRQRFEV